MSEDGFRYGRSTEALRQMALRNSVYSADRSTEQARAFERAMQAAQSDAQTQMSKEARVERSAVFDRLDHGLAEAALRQRATLSGRSPWRHGGVDPAGVTAHHLPASSSVAGQAAGRASLSPSPGGTPSEGAGALRSGAGPLQDPRMMNASLPPPQQRQQQASPSVAAGGDTVSGLMMALAQSQAKGGAGRPAAQGDSMASSAVPTQAQTQTQTAAPGGPDGPILSEAVNSRSALPADDTDARTGEGESESDQVSRLMPGGAWSPAMGLNPPVPNEPAPMRQHATAGQEGGVKAAGGVQRSEGRSALTPGGSSLGGSSGPTGQDESARMTSLGVDEAINGEAVQSEVESSLAREMANPRPSTLSDDAQAALLRWADDAWGEDAKASPDMGAVTQPSTGMGNPPVADPAPTTARTLPATASETHLAMTRMAELSGGESKAGESQWQVVLPGLGSDGDGLGLVAHQVTPGPGPSAWQLSITGVSDDTTRLQQRLKGQGLMVDVRFEAPTESGRQGS